MSGKDKDNRPKGKYGGVASENQGTEKQKGGKDNNTGDSKQTGKHPK